ncbi:MAG TPA: rhodanese-like domain-containing protein [Gemmatimonadaceae bacterium]|nr:rhodanese-like domain-containing protein [Gemmatimonadaceae bacterium]
MLLRRLYHDRLAQAGYLVACQATKEAIVVDPLRDPTPYLEAARQEGVTITAVTETHLHADFLSGAPALAAATGATLMLSGEGQGPAGYHRASFPSARWLHDGDRLRFGKVVLNVMHVPGHTPEHIAFLVTDTAADELPMGMLSGDFLFVGDVGRPDLLERAAGMQGTMDASARQLYASLRRLAQLPDYLQIWPGHGAGSACGKALGAVPQSTLGYERRTNWALADMSEEEFVRRALEGQPEPPPYFARMKALNAVGVFAPASARPVPSDALIGALRDGALPVDVRSAEEFAAGFLPGALNVPLGNSFLAWAGSVVPPDRDIVVVAAPTLRASAEQAVRELQLIGIDRVLGVLAPERLTLHDGAVLSTLPSVPAVALEDQARRGVTLLDVRNRSEWDEGHLPGARLIPLPELASRLDELRGLGSIAVHCQGGSRSAVAASLLRAAGFDDVVNVEGGYSAWLRAGNAPVFGG